MGSCCDVFNFAPHVVEHIFLYLSLRDLVVQQRVCKLWKLCSERILRQKSKVCKLEMLTSIKMWKEDEHEWKDAPPNVNFNFLERDFMEWRKAWRFIPSMLFCTFDFVQYHNLIPKLEKNWIPEECCALVLETEGPMCIDSEKSEIEEDPTTVNKSNSCNLVGFSKKLKPSIMYLKTGEGDSSTNMFMCELKLMLSNQNTKFILVFCETNHLEKLDILKNDITDAVKKGMVVIGCGLDKTPLLIYPNEEVETDIVITSFDGSDVKAASTMIDMDVIGDELTISKLFENISSLKSVIDNFCESCPNHNLDKFGYCKACHSQTIGFIIMPPRSSQEWYEEYDDDPRPVCFNQEQDAFRTIFPKVPLFGVYSRGIVGGSVNMPSVNNFYTSLPSEDDFAMVFSVLLVK